MDLTGAAEPGDAGDPRTGFMDFDGIENEEAAALGVGCRSRRVELG
jgi:hypothetical protein